MELSGYKNVFARKRSYIDKVYWILLGVLIIVAILALFSASSTLALKNNSASHYGSYDVYRTGSSIGLCGAIFTE